MTGPAQQFRSRQEIETRRSFDPSCGIELAEFGSLVGAYEFPENEQVKCQLVSGHSTLKSETPEIRAIHRAGILAVASQITPAAAVKTNSASWRLKHSRGAPSPPMWCARLL